MSNGHSMNRQARAGCSSERERKEAAEFGYARSTAASLRLVWSFCEIYWVAYAVVACTAACAAVPQGCVFTRDINQAIMISDAMETGTVQVRHISPPIPGYR